MRQKNQSMVRDIEIMDERGNQTSDIVWEIAVNYSRDWSLGERWKLAWQILRGQG
jgi:hypothetical protein